MWSNIRKTNLTKIGSLAFLPSTLANTNIFGPTHVLFLENDKKKYQDALNELSLKTERSEIYIHDNAGNLIELSGRPNISSKSLFSKNEIIDILFNSQPNSVNKIEKHNMNKFLSAYNCENKNKVILDVENYKKEDNFQNKICKTFFQNIENTNKEKHSCLCMNNISKDIDTSQETFDTEGILPSAEKQLSDFDNITVEKYYAKRHKKEPCYKDVEKPRLYIDDCFDCKKDPPKRPDCHPCGPKKKKPCKCP